MRKERLTSLGAILAALLGTACCLGPILFVVFGTTLAFTGQLTALEPLRPWFLGLAGALLGGAFWKLYLKKAPCACPEDIRTRRISRALFWVGTAVWLAALFSPQILLWIYR